MELCEMIKVVQHFKDGGEVEFNPRSSDSTLWIKTSFPNWNWVDFNFRIKEPEKKITIEKWLCRDRQGDFIVIEILNADNYGLYEKVKLIESYEVEL